MGAFHTFARLLDATKPDPFAPIARITTPVWQPNERLQALLLADRDLTADEWAYISACEDAASELEIQ